MLARGQGVTQDVDGGRAMVREVAETGNTAALISLGDLYGDAGAGPVDATSAISAYEKAASLGDLRGLLRLGDVYRDGRIVPPDGDRAIEYYVKAATFARTKSALGSADVSK